MLSWSFCAAAAALVVVAALLPARARPLGLALTSLLAAHAVWDVPLLVPLGLTVGVWVLGRWLPAAPPLLRSTATAGAVVVVLLPFVRAKLGASDPWLSPGITLGISYVTLKLVQHLLDAAAGRTRGVGLSSFLAAIFFLPTWPSGPIERSHEFSDKLLGAPLGWRERTRGAERIVLAIGKKFLLADPLLAWALPLYGDPGAQGVAVMWGAVYAYAFGLYFDFSAYSDLAIGVGALAGVRLRENFDRPYAQPNLAALWQRWHMSLTSWLRDFIFVPVARRMLRLTRSPFASQAAALVVTMVACGLWHGFAWHYVVWGAYNGVLLGALAYYRARRGAASPSPVRHLAAVVGTFHVFALGLVLFANDLPRAIDVFARLAGG